MITYPDHCPYLHNNNKAKKPLSRVSKDWSADPTLLKSCPACFKDPDHHHGGGGGDAIAGKKGNRKD